MWLVIAANEYASQAVSYSIYYAPDEAIIFFVTASSHTASRGFLPTIFREHTPADTRTVDEVAAPSQVAGRAPNCPYIDAVTL
jgi:hypothetical protein